MSQFLNNVNGALALETSRLGSSTGRLDWTHTTLETDQCH